MAPRNTDDDLYVDDDTATEDQESEDTDTDDDAQDSGDDADSHDDDGDDDDDSDKVYDAAYVKKLRKENAKYRRGNREAVKSAAQKAAEEAREAFARDLASAFGFDEDDEATPEELIERANARADEADARLRAHEVSDALSAAARTHDGDIDLLIPYLRGKGLLKDLDPDDDDFADQVSEVVESAIDSNPKLKASVSTAPAKRSGGDMSGGNNAPKRKGPESIDDIRAARRKRRQEKYGLL